MSREIWQANIFDEIPKILNEEPTEKRASFLAALYAIQDHLGNEDVHDKAGPLAEPKRALCYARDELKSADTYHRMGLDDFAEDELRHAHHFIGEARKEARSTQEQNEVHDLETRYSLMKQNIG